ncbi:unnamed protein product [Chrysoparadoxa australica]
MLRSTCGEQLKAQTRRTQPWRSTSAGKWRGKARMVPPIRTEYFLLGEATTCQGGRCILVKSKVNSEVMLLFSFALIFMVEGASRPNRCRDKPLHQLMLWVLERPGQGQAGVIKCIK